MRAVGLDIHREFCEVAIMEAGELRSVGRVKTTPEALLSAKPHKPQLRSLHAPHRQGHAHSSGEGRREHDRLGGTLTAGKKLAPGTYSLTITASAGNAASAPTTITLTIKH